MPHEPAESLITLARPDVGKPLALPEPDRPLVPAVHEKFDPHAGVDLRGFQD